MNKTKKIFTSLFSLLFLAVSFFLILHTTNSFLTNAENENINNGLDFISSHPTEKQTFEAGDGYVEYTPQTEDKNATIVLSNATLYANTQVNYWSQNKVYCALAVNNDTEIILNGSNKLFIKGNESSSGILAYDANITFSGDGDLTIDYNSEPSLSGTAYPIIVYGNYDVLNNLIPGTFEESGNLIFNNTGTININAIKKISSACIYAHNNITINSGNFILNGIQNSIQTDYNNLTINNANIECTDFTSRGFYARRGNVVIDNNSNINLVAKTDRKSTFGICAGNSNYTDEDSIEAGNVLINDGILSINVAYIGIYAQALDSKQDSGNIIISDGLVNITANKNNGVTAGIYAECSQSGKLGNVFINGGNTTILTEGSPSDASVGIYSANDVTINNGILNISSLGNDDNTSYGINANKDLYINGGEITIKSNDFAINKNPIISDNIKLSPATDVDGNNKVDYDETQLNQYKYLKTEIINEISEIKINEIQNPLKKGDSIQLETTISGVGSYDMSLTWSISGATSKDTVIDANGKLTIGKDEKSKEIIVTATSNFDSSKFDSIIIKIKNGLTTQNIIFIVIAGIIAIVFIVLFIMFLIKRNHKKQVKNAF